MKVLLIWEQIPEETSFYLLEGKAAEAATAAHGQLIGSTEDSAAAERLAALLKNEIPLPLDKPFQTGGDVVVVFSGWIM